VSRLFYRSLEYVLGRLKGREYKLDQSVSPKIILAASLRRAVWLARGWFKCLVFQRRIRIVFMAPRVDLRNAALIRFARGVTLERGVIIDGLSRDGIELGNNVMIGPYSMIRASGLASGLGVGVKIGDDSALDAYSFVGAGGGVWVGKYVIMGQHVSFHAENHNFDRCDLPIKYQGIQRQGIVIEDDCWIGSNVTFLDGAHVERGCVIAAGSVVRGRIPAYSVAAGVPAKTVRSRGPKEEAFAKAH
jgi:acetyltransferase-like isoleucine patch superfamily enzyme